MIRTALRLSMCFAVLCLLTASSSAQFSEGFDTIIPLTPPAVNGTVVNAGYGNWEGALRSAPLGSTGIFQGNDTVFPAQAGPSTSYLGMNFNNSGSPGSINSWAMTPEVTLNNGDQFSFWTRAADQFFPDRLELRMSTSGSSTNVGAGANDVGDFSTMLVSINPNLQPATYPEVWTQFTGVVSGLGGPTQGRFGFRYTVSDAGPLGNNSNYIGIDSVTYSPVPEPASLALVAAGIGLIGLRRRFAK